jgi:hypothetical protein
VFPGTERCVNVNAPPIRWRALGLNPSKPLHLQRIRSMIEIRPQWAASLRSCLCRFPEVGSCEGFG